MPKLRTSSAAKKKFRVTRTGKVLRRKAFSSHLLGKKSSARKRPYAKNHSLTGKNRKNMKRMIGK